MNLKKQELEQIKIDYIKRYLEIIEKNGICKKSKEYSGKIERLEEQIKYL